MRRLYQGTNLLTPDGITSEQKLIPNKQNASYALEAGYPVEDYKGYLFFTDSLSNAIHYSTLAFANVKNSHNGLEDLHNLNVVLEVELLEEDLIPDKCDAPEATSWEESLSKCRAVSVKGEVLIGSVKRILFCHYEIDNVLVISSISNWRSTIREYAHYFHNDNIDEVLTLYEKGYFPIEKDIVQ